MDRKRPGLPEIATGISPKLFDLPSPANACPFVTLEQRLLDTHSVRGFVIAYGKTLPKPGVMLSCQHADSSAASPSTYEWLSCSLQQHD